MSKHIDDFITLAQGSTDLADLSSLFEKIIRNMGFGEWAYQVVNQKTESKPLILGSYPESWVQHYVEQSYQKIDPVIINGPQQSRLFLWSGLKPKEGLIKKQEIFFNEAKEFGLKDGVGLPIHGVNGGYSMISASINASSEEISKICKEHQVTLQLVSYIYNNFAQNFISERRLLSDAVLLTPKEKECLQWAYAGKTYWETSQIMGISEKTVDFHLANVRGKLSVFSTREAVVKAIMFGILPT